MTRGELFSRIATFPIVADELAEDLLTGDYRSIFRGQGIEFDEVRRYERGDDARSIDWNVSARFGAPYVKLFREERELNVFLVVDASASMDSGGGALSRREQAVFAAALIALSAERAGERVGALLFDGDARRFFAPRKGRRHTMAIIDAAVSATATERGPALVRSLGKALEGASRVLKRRSLIAVVSDFLCIGWERPLGILARRHEVVACRIGDPVDLHMVDAGLVSLRDEESGRELMAATGSSAFREAWVDWNADRIQAWRLACARHKVACLDLSTDDEAPIAIARFFGARRRS
jgi:uncharacterized protein (DUF58 family)